MNRIKTSLSALLFAIYLSGCTSYQEKSTPLPSKSKQSALTSNTAKTKQASAQSAPPPFSAAMAYLKPLEKISGDLGTSFKPSFNKANAFKNAVDYAEELASYSLLIWHNGELILEQYFNGFDANLRSDTASMHKSVLALLIAAAIEDGYIGSVDDPVSQYLSNWQGQPKGDITLLNLLTMSSGLHALSSEGGAKSPRIQFFLDGSKARSTLNALTLENPPGSRFRYANTNSQILGMVLESATGKSYQQYLSERLWQRIGADDAYVWNNEPSGFPRTYTALLARPRDWLRIGLLFKNNGLHQGDQIIASSLIDSIITPSEANPNYGWQIWLGNQYQEKRYYNDSNTGPSFGSAEPFKAQDMIYFDGIGGQRVYISRSESLVVVRTGDLRFDWDDTKLPNLVLEALRKAPK